jgi:hypothetical protein
VNWVPDEEYGQLIHEAWECDIESEATIQMARGKLEWCKSKLQRWSREKFRKNECLIKDKKKALIKLQEMDGPERNEAIKAFQ